MASKSKDIAAAEKALGLDPVGLETKAEADLRRAWERRFAPLGLALREEMPPDDMLLRIMRSVDKRQGHLALRKAKRRTARWRIATAASLALAAGLAAFAVLPTLQKSTAPPQTAPARYVAVITPEGGTASMVVEVDLDAKTARVRPVGVKTPEDRALELWRIPEGGEPVSAGIIEASQITEVSLDGMPGDTIAITLEPEGGAPDGKPSGPPVYSGILVEVPQ